MTRPRVLIVGGGFAGVACSQQLSSRQFDVTLIDRRPCFEFLPAIHELLSARKSAAEVSLSLAALQQHQGHGFLRAEVTSVCPQRRAVVLGNGRELTADYLLLSPGSVPAGRSISGVQQHAQSLHSTADALHIRRSVQRLRRAAGRRRLVIVGAGWTGIEALGELLRDRRRPLELHLVEAGAQLLPGGPPPVAAFLAQRCADLGVTVHMGRAVERVTAKTLFFADGGRLRNELLIWTAGTALSPLLTALQSEEPSLATNLNDDLSLPAYPQCFVAGDSASLQRPLPRQAYHALDMGVSVARNITRLARERSSRRFLPLPRPSLLAFGDEGAILIAGRRAFAGVPVALAKEAVYQAVMGQLDQRSLPARLGALRQRGTALPEHWWPLLKDWRQLRQQAGVTRLA